MTDCTIGHIDSTGSRMTGPLLVGALIAAFAAPYVLTANFDTLQLPDSPAVSTVVYTDWHGNVARSSSAVQLETDLTDTNDH